MTVSSEMAATPTDSTFLKSLWTPVVKELKDMGGDEASVAQMAWWYIFILGFLGGLVALCTPCVWPIIPMTVSFFPQAFERPFQGHPRRHHLRHLHHRDLRGARPHHHLHLRSQRPQRFEHQRRVQHPLLPDAPRLCRQLLRRFLKSRCPHHGVRLLTAKPRRTTGLLSIFLMAFTLSLVSFSCTGPHHRFPAR